MVKFMPLTGEGWGKGGRCKNGVCRVIRVSKLFVLFLLIFFSVPLTRFWAENTRIDKAGSCYTLGLCRNSSLKLIKFVFNAKWKFGVLSDQGCLREGMKISATCF